MTKKSEGPESARNSAIGAELERALAGSSVPQSSAIPPEPATLLFVWSDGHSVEPLRAAVEDLG